MKILLAVLIPMFMFVSCGGGSDSDDNDRNENRETFETPMELLRSLPQFSTLVEIIERNNLQDELNLDQEMTLFAPTDESFENLPEGALDIFLGNESLARALVENLVVRASLPQAEIARAQEIVNQVGLTLEVDNNGESVSVGGATIVYPDLTFRGGFVQGIDRLFENI